MDARRSAASFARAVLFTDLVLFLRADLRANEFASIERQAKKSRGRPLGTKDGREGPGREEAMTRRP